MARRIGPRGPACRRPKMEQDMASRIRIERAAAAWLARRDAGGWAARDQAGLDAWLAASTAHRVAWLRLQAAWRESGRRKGVGGGLPPGRVPARGQWDRAARADAIIGAAPRAARPSSDGDASTGSGRPAPDLAALVFAPRRRDARSRLPRRLAAVASVAVVAAALAAGWHLREPTVQPVAYGTPVGALETASLADGSEATLSSDSRIVVALSRRERHVELERGEAFFQAARDPARPFVVAAAGHRAVAVGTRFAVRRDAAGVRVVVTEGLVRLESD